MVVGSNPVAVTSSSDFATASSKEFLDIQATIVCGFTLKRVRDMIKTYSQYLTELTDSYKNKGEWKVQLIADINFISLKPGSDETRSMYTKSDNVEIRIGDDINDVIKEIFKSLLNRYQENLQEKMRGSDFGFDGINLLYYDFNKISLNRG